MHRTSVFNLSTCVPLAKAALVLILASYALAHAAPFTPGADGQVLERLPARATDPRARDLARLREAWRAQPQNLDSALRLARAYYDAVAAEGDPRYIGYAQAALQPWWNDPAPPPGVRVQRAVLRQFDHRFEAALADLDAALQADPELADAWAWRAAIHLVRADYAQARRSCEGLASRAPRLIGVACTAQVDAVTGRAAAAASSLQAALEAQTDVDLAQRLWALTRLAETHERIGAWTAAEAAFRDGLAVGRDDVYLLAAYADFLLDRGRPAEVQLLLKDRGRADVLLLRQALAARALGSPNAPQAAALGRELDARFAAARARGDTTHQKEEARYLLGLRAHEPASLQAALTLAGSNFAEQREPADARLLLEAALAARDRSAAEPALKWMTESRIESVALAGLASRVKGLR